MEWNIPEHPKYMSKRQFGHFAKNTVVRHLCNLTRFLKILRFQVVFKGTLSVVESWRLAKKSRQSNLNRETYGNVARNRNDNDKDPNES